MIVIYRWENVVSLELESEVLNKDFSGVIVTGKVLRRLILFL